MAKAKKDKKVIKTTETKEPEVFLNMTYTEAMKKALNTPLPSKPDQKKKAK